MAFLSHAWLNITSMYSISCRAITGLPSSMQPEEGLGLEWQPPETELGRKFALQTNERIEVGHTLLKNTEGFTGSSSRAPSQSPGCTISLTQQWFSPICWPRVLPHCFLCPLGCAVHSYILCLNQGISPKKATWYISTLSSCLGHSSNYLLVSVGISLNTIQCNFSFENFEF